MQTGLPFKMQINCQLSIVETHREHDRAETLPLMSISYYSVGTYSQISLSSMTFQCSAAWGLNGKKMTMVFYNRFFFSLVCTIYKWRHFANFCMGLYLNYLWTQHAQRWTFLENKQDKQMAESSSQSFLCYCTLLYSYFLVILACCKLCSVIASRPLTWKVHFSIAHLRKKIFFFSSMTSWPASYILIYLSHELTFMDLTELQGEKPQSSNTNC